MLVLQRRFREGVTITDRRTGEKIKVVVVKTGDHVRLGFVASDDYIIMRDELLAEPVSADIRGSDD